MKDDDEKLFVEKNIEIPSAWGRAGGKYGIIDKMEVGDSILVEKCDIGSVRHRARLKNPGEKFVTRKEGKTHNRFWRIE